mgnify:CR=1 FL=1
MQNFISRILNSDVSTNNISIFCGAGISMNSGLPTANGLLKEIFNGIGADEYINIDDIIKKLPFEAIVERMVDYTQNNDILTFFADNSLQPNSNHHFIVKMIMDGFVERIYTPNFDLLFEKVAKGYSKLFTVLHKESEFTNHNLNDKNVKLIKIHGSAHDIDSMKITLKSVANKTQIEARNNVISNAFDSGKPQVIVFLGYSCSDFFDIVPAIQSIKNSNTEIIFVQHGDVYKENDINKLEKIKEVENPFKQFSGTYIEISTDDFIICWYRDFYK